MFTHLWKLDDRPKELKERVFKKLFEVAEIAKFSKEEQKAYEESLKNYRDIKNIVDTARAEGKAEGKLESKMVIARKMKERGMSNQEIKELTGLTDVELTEL